MDHYFGHYFHRSSLGKWRSELRMGVTWSDVDNWSFHSSEFSTVSLRPYLTVAFTPPQPANLDLDANNSSGAFGSGANATWTENGGPVAISDTDATITDSDSTTLTSMVVSITNRLDGSAESLAANTSGTSISASYDSATGVLTLTGMIP